MLSFTTNSLLYRIFQSPNGPIRHVDSVQHQSLFMSNTAQMPQMMHPYQPFHPPSVGPPPAMPPQSPAPSAMQPTMGAAGGMLWKPPTVPVANGNNNSTAANSYYHHHRPNEQQQLNSRYNLTLNNSKINFSN